MELKERFMNELRPKASSFGFSKEELESAVSALMSNFHPTGEEATDEEISNAVDGAIPFLKVGQSFGTRVSNKYREEQERKAKEEAERNKPKEDNGEMPAWFKAYKEEQDAKFKAIETRNTADNRKKMLEEALKDGGSFATRTLRDFERISFKDDADFDSYLANIRQDKEVYLQETQGNGGQGRPFGGSKKNKEQIEDEAFENSMKALNTNNK